MTALSPGILDSSFQMLGMFARTGMTVAGFSMSFPRVGVCKTEDVMEFALGVSWIHPGESGIVELTAGGRRILSLENHESRMKQSVLDFVEEFEPAWVQNAAYGRRKVLDFVGSDVRQILVEAGLATGHDRETVRFWDILAAQARGQKDVSLAEIGRRGESLTIAYETGRTGHEPKWVSVDNNADGYDVLSVVAVDNLAKLSIEVKTTTLGTMGSFHITKNEWERAVEAECHCFHLWMLRGENDSESTLAVIGPAEMMAHVPVDSGVGMWSSFVAPFSAFTDFFESRK
jgi:hypothetical protein